MPIDNKTKKDVVKQFQLDLQLLGYNPGKADGFSGQKTENAAHDFADDHKITDKFGDSIPDAVLNEVTRLANLKRNPTIPVPPKFLDLTASAWPKPRVFAREWSKVDSITIHQCGATLSESPARWSNFMTKNKEGVITSSSLKAHVGITTKGNIYQIHPWESFIWSAQSLSHRSISLEVNGCHNGLLNNPKTYPGTKGTKPSVLTQEQIDSTKNLIRYIKQILISHGSDLKTIFPHRISTNSRRPDCGEAIWKEIIIPIMEELNINSGVPGYKLGSGYPICEEWDERYKGYKY